MRRNSTGFSLLELMAVLAVIALMIAIALPRLPVATTDMKLRAEARSIHDLLEEAASRALSERRPVAVTLDLQAMSISLGRETKPLDRQTAITITSAEAQDAQAGAASFVFYPDGTASGGRIDLALAGHEISVETNWLTGHVRTFRTKAG
jgi:general secretion pathway protein H